MFSPTLTNKIMTNWKQDFKTRFTYNKKLTFSLVEDCSPTALIDFIEKTLEKQQEDIQLIMGELSDVERRNPYKRTKCCGYHQALADLEDKLNTLNKE